MSRGWWQAQPAPDRPGQKGSTSLRLLDPNERRSLPTNKQASIKGILGEFSLKTKQRSL